MLPLIKDNFQSIAEKIYEKVFKEEITPNIKIFFKNLTYVVFGYGVAAIFIFVFQVLIGRALGPQEYGKYVLIDSAAAFLSIFMTLGVSTAAIKYNAEKEDYLRQQKIISSSYFATLTLSFIFVLLLFIFSKRIYNVFSVSPLVFFTAVVSSVCYALYLLATDSLSGLYQMKKIALFRVVYGFLVLAILAPLLFKSHISFVFS